ncbi:MAG: type II toxin-antitoxin system PemK/MazF family toxin [Rhodoferax sp.]|nr:type II toxin-antitoxin system PemK/MazF family toxin [Rhodoferax sp.]
MAKADRADTRTTVLLITSRLVFAPLLRVTVEPSAGNGLQKIKKIIQVMVDKAVTVKRDKLGPVFGRMAADAWVEIERCLAVFWELQNERSRQTRPACNTKLSPLQPRTALRAQASPPRC